MSAVDLDKPVELKTRTVVGKGLEGLRSDGLVPAVLHNHGQASLHVMAEAAELEKIYEAAGKHHPLQLKVGDQNFLALIKNVQRHPLRRDMRHIVFQAIRRDEKVEAEVPVRLMGEMPAERIGLIVLTQLDHVEVEALPQKLPDELVVDATKLAELHDKITVADIPVPEGVTILTDAEHPIANVVEPRVIEEPEPEEVEGEEIEGEEAVEGTEPSEGGEEPTEQEAPEDRK